MKFLKAKKLLALLLALVASFALIACSGNDEVLKELDEAINSITLGDTTALRESFDINNLTNKHELEITWELVDNDSTLKLERKNDELTTVVVNPTDYTEDSEGKQTNAWGKGTLKATIEKDGESVSREWELFVEPGSKTNSLTVRAIKEVDEETGVELSGTVRYVGPYGFYVEDETGAIYVYTKSAPAENIAAGAEVIVKGIQDLYYDQPQIIEPITQVVNAAPAAGYDYSKVEEVKIANFIAATTADLDHFGKMVKITGMVIKNYVSPANGQTVSAYAIQDTTDNSVVALYDNTSDAVKNLLANKVGAYVSIVVIADGFHSSQKVWRHYGVDGTVVDAEAPTLTDAEIVAAVKDEIVSKYSGKSFASDLNLITAGMVGGTVTWSSSNTDVIANDGKLTSPQTDTEVTLTYTITSGELTEEYTLKVTALAVTKMTIKEATTALDAANKFVYVEGVIIGQDVDGYYYLADETGVLYVRHKLSADSLVIGNKVKVMGNGTVFTGTNNAQYSRQISGNYTVIKVDEEIHASPLAAVDAQISDFDFTITSADLLTKAPAEELYGKIVKFNAFITIQGTYSNVYLATSTAEGAPKILVYYKSVGVDDLKALVGKQVEVTAVVYDYHVKDGWRLGFLNREGDLEFELTNEEKLAFAKDEIETVVSEDKAIAGDLDFFVDAKSTLISTAKYTWTTNNLTVIAADGKFTAPTVDTEVEVTVKVFLNGVTTGTADAEYRYTVLAKAPVAVAGGVMISQAYGGGGNSNSQFRNDFIELYNSTDEDIDLTGWVVFYASKTGVFKTQGTETYDTAVVLTGTIKAKGFYLIKASGGTTNPTAPELPTPDATTGIGMAGDGFKLALCNTNVAPIDASSANVVDFVGANSNLFDGTVAPAPSNTKAIVRSTLTDTDNNGVDFVTADPNPRNSATPVA